MNNDKQHKLEKLLTLLGLLHKRDHFVSQLSGGMKRKLSLAMALVDDPEVSVIEFHFCSHFNSNAVEGTNFG